MEAPAPPEPRSDDRAPATEPGRLPAEILERVRARDPEALASFFEHYFDRVFALVQRLLGERAAAEDVTQEVFLKVYRAAHRIDPGRDPAPWLVTIAYNACRDVWRSGAHRLARRSGSIEAEPALAARLASDGGDPEADLLAGERVRHVRAAIDRLPEPLRAAVLLHEYQGLSHQDVARLTGVNHAAARKRYSRALAELGRMLRETLT